ncbi:MAG: metalloregulator ArsR/SmtB family transcription factor [Euryarchaeota archaeon]|nr:metalloregulator ArsR/SmtB family transcription factor [Euryarchaeota archaeon]
MGQRVSELNKKIFELHAEICQILANPKRLEILDILRDGEKTVTELASLANIPQANLSQHLALLRKKKIVESRREGVNIFYKITNPKIIQACSIIRDILFEQLADDEKLAKKIRGRR